MFKETHCILRSVCYISIIPKQSNPNGTFMNHDEKHLRSIIKGISWRVVGTLDTMIISYIVTGNLTYAGIIGLAESCTKIFLFWGHERCWQKISWGYKKPA